MYDFSIIIVLFNLKTFYNNWKIRTFVMYQCANILVNPSLSNLQIIENTLSLIFFLVTIFLLHFPIKAQQWADFIAPIIFAFLIISVNFPQSLLFFVVRAKSKIIIHYLVQFYHRRGGTLVSHCYSNKVRWISVTALIIHTLHHRS